MYSLLENGLQSLILKYVFLIAVIASYFLKAKIP